MCCSYACLYGMERNCKMPRTGVQNFREQMHRKLFTRYIYLGGLSNFLKTMDWLTIISNELGMISRPHKKNCVIQLFGGFSSSEGFLFLETV